MQNGSTKAPRRPNNRETANTRPTLQTGAKRPDSAKLDRSGLADRFPFRPITRSRHRRLARSTVREFIPCGPGTAAETNYLISISPNGETS